MKYEMIDCPKCGGTGFRGVGKESNYNCYNCSGKKQIKSDYIIIDDPAEAILFLGKRVIFEGKHGEHDTDILDGDWLQDVIFSKTGWIKVHKSVVKEICTADKQYPCFNFTSAALDFHLPIYDVFREERTNVAVNSLTMYKTVRELKELIDWYTES